MHLSRWTRAAKSDLKGIVLYISEQDGRRQTAKRIAREIYEKCTQYAAHPFLGESYPNLGEGFRGFVYKRWLIVYQPRDYGIEVFAVLDSAQDFASFFRRRLGLGE